jgi:hypothetical protein
VYLAAGPRNTSGWKPRVRTCFLQPSVEHLREIATRDIGALPGENPLTVVLAGYIHSDDPPLGCLYWISNFEGLGAKRYGPDPVYLRILRNHPG